MGWGNYAPEWAAINAWIAEDVADAIEWALREREEEGEHG